LLIGNLSGTASKVLIGYARTIDGNSSLELYSNQLTPTISSFSITRLSGANGIATIEQLGTGRLNISSVASGSWIDLVGNNSNGYIRFSNSLNTETMRVDVANQRVGILTNNPQEALHVNGNIHVSGADRTIFNRDAFYLAFGTNNTERMRILSSGLIGINTTTPTDLLEVGDGNIAISDVTTPINGIGKGIKFKKTTFSSSINLYRGSFDNNLGLSFINSNTGATSEAMRIHPSGVISIGNSTAHLATPTLYRVHIQDNTNHSLLIRSNVSSGGSKNNILFQKQNGTTAVTAGTFIGGLSFGGFDGNDWSIGSNGGAEMLVGIPSTWSLTSKPAFVSINTTPNSTTTALERFRISSAGNISIGAQGDATFNLEFQNNGDKVIGLSITPSGAGNDLTVGAGSANGTNLAGGDLNLRAGRSTGLGTSAIRFWGLNTLGSGSTLSSYEEKAFMNNAGRWAFGHLDNPNVSTVDVKGGIRLRGVTTTNAVHATGIRFNSESNDSFESEIRAYQGSGNDQLGLSFLTTSGGATPTERMRINPDGGILIADDNYTTSSTYIINGGTTGGAGALILFMSFASQQQDRVVYCSTNSSMEYLGTYPSAGIFYAIYEITNGSSTIVLKEMIIDNTSRSIVQGLAHSFILPAGWSFRMRGYKTGLTFFGGGSIAVTAASARLGLQ
jgi:hypothetical protein